MANESLSETADFEAQNRFVEPFGIGTQYPEAFVNWLIRLSKANGVQVTPFLKSLLDQHEILIETDE
jgi:hypothetical protein